MPLNKVVVGAPSEAAVPVCVFAVVGKQLSADAMLELELLDDVLVEELVELDTLDVLEELEVADEELVELDVLEVADEELELLVVAELLDELLLFDALPVDVALTPSDPEAPPLHAVTNKQRLAKMLKKL
jgi:hypothetical protein